MLTLVPELQPQPAEDLVELLEREELELLSRGVGEHLPIELRLRVAAIRRRRVELDAPLGLA